jgi:uncharacterized membrane protein HdeD (DUF308 family)
MTDAAPSPGEEFARYEARIFVLPQHNWKWFLLRGLIAIALGVVALFFPGLTLVAFALVFAAFSFADGLFSLVAGIRGASSHAERWGALVLSGLLGIGVGVVFFVWPLVATAAYAFVLVLLIAFWALFSGLFELSAAVRLRKEIKGEVWLGLVGLFSIALAIAVFWLLATSTSATLLSVGWLIGIYALASGVALLALAFRLRSYAAAGA